MPDLLASLAAPVAARLVARRETVAVSESTWLKAQGPTPMEELKRVRGAVPAVPLLVGSGVTPEGAAELFSIADGLIVGTAVKRGGVLANPVDPRRVRRLVEAARGSRG